ncbi:MAG: sigma-70 family RNA polymerase sigma factor [Pyrinomonadaceae bacterium]
MSESGTAENFFVVSEPDETGDRALADTARRNARTDSLFEEFYRNYSGLVHGIIIAKVPITEAEDLVQEVFLSAFKFYGSLRNKDAAGPWLAAIARNRAAEYYRSRKPTEELGEFEPEIRGVTAEAQEALAAIRSLPDAYRETLILRLVEGFTGPEIAGLTGLKEASVRVNLHRGMKLLRAKLGIDR